MGVLKLFEGTGDMYCAIATIKTPEGSTQKVVDGTAFSVGRAPDCVLSIPDVGISRLHMLVTSKRGEIYITDQGSSNGTFINGERIESKRLIHVKPTDEIKLGKSDIIMQFGCIEKHFKTDYIAESLLPVEEKNQLQSIIKASHHKAQEIVSMAQTQADQLHKISMEKARNTENQTLLMQEEVLSKAHVESQNIISETKRKSAQMIFEAEEQARQATESIRHDAENKRHEADSYYQNKIKEAQVHGDQILEKHTLMGQQMIADLRRSTIEKAEKEAKEQLSQLFNLLDEKSEEFEKIKVSCAEYESNHRKNMELELKSHREEFFKKFDYEKQTAIDEHQNRMALLEADYLHKRQELDETTSNRVKDTEDRIRILNEKLDQDYAEKKVRLEIEHADRIKSVERNYSELKITLEQEYQARQSKLVEDFEKNKLDFTTTLEKQRNRLESEVESQRQNLQQIRTEIDDYSERHLSLKFKFDSLSQTVKVLESTEAGLSQQVAEKRKEFESVNGEHKRVSDSILELDLKYQELQKAHLHLKNQFEEDHLKYRKELDQEMQKVRSEIKKKTSEYESLEKIKLEEIKLSMLSEKKQLDLNFDRMKKEYELKTKEAIEFEKKKLEDAKQQFLALMNNQRAVVINELTKAIIKIEKRGEIHQSSELISHAVTQVFDSNVAEFSLTANSQGSVENQRKIKVQWLSYGIGSAFAVVFAFIFFVQPIINRNIKGTDENRIAQEKVKERAKFKPSQDLEYRDTYVDATLYTSKFAEIYLDEQLHDKWFKHITDYMFQTWRVPEEKTIEVSAISKSLVESIRARAAEFDAEYADKGIEKLKEAEADAIKRMADALGTQVKFEAYKRKEREFFEPYVQNQ